MVNVITEHPGTEAVCSCVVSGCSRTGPASPGRAGPLRLYHESEPRMPIAPRSADTTPDAERVQIDLLRAAPVARRLHLALQLTATVIGAPRRAIGRAQPHDSPQDRDLRFVDLHYGADVAAGLRKDLDRRSRTPGCASPISVVHAVEPRRSTPCPDRADIG